MGRPTFHSICTHNRPAVCFSVPHLDWIASGGETLCGVVGSLTLGYSLRPEILLLLACTEVLSCDVMTLQDRGRPTDWWGFIIFQL